MLIIANHVTAFDGPLIEYALPGALRRRMAVAMSGEMLEDYRHFRNPEPLHPSGRLLSAGSAVLFAADGAVQRVSAAAAAGFPAQLRARGAGHGSRLQRAGVS